ncbi:AI-2E family transporter [Paenibacillus nasutitermitis]|uniref:AI-2E family transporter n=1 Tax=Paenibacillus nasutitermitis TaxID=1652958 RepID=A0A917DMT3_9BACL|nr:AI-2E family transporter [Paenibacillus nasutitermitis]GGD53607.1 AI-2E family transporter [Paenibacillus nasutitermitis]
MEVLRQFFAHSIVKRIVFLLLVLLLLYSLRHMINLLLLLFLVTFVMGRLEGIVTRKLNRLFPVSPIIVNVGLYLLLISSLVYGIFNYAPKIVSQVVDMINNISRFLSHSQNDEVARQLAIALEKVDYQKYLGSAVDYIMKLGKWLEIILFVILLSFFYLLQKNKVVAFTSKFGNSKIGWIYREFDYFGTKFVSSFGKVIEVQLMIALFNTILTMIGLWILGFPYLFALTIMVFLLSLIPVAGVIISFIPIGIIGYQIGGFSLVLWAIILILVIHSLETYFLNPRLYAHKTKLPMFYTFIILIFSQHYMGIWGLIIGIPIFMFLLDVLEVEQSE